MLSKDRGFDPGLFVLFDLAALRCSHIRFLFIGDVVLCAVQVLWESLTHVTALVFASALRRIQEVQAQMDLPHR